MYHGEGHCGYPVKLKNKTVIVYCNYAAVADSTCLKHLNSHQYYDLRGTEYSKCKLFKESEELQNGEE